MSPESYKWVPAGQSDRIRFSVHGDMLNPAGIRILKDLYTNLDDALGRGMLYHYSGTLSSLYWITLCRNPEYGHIELVALIDRSFPEVTRMLQAGRPQNNVINLVSLGAGDGETDIAILRHLEDAFDFRCYYCIDFSFELLRHAVFRISSAKGLKNGFRIHAICGNFVESADLLSQEESVRLFSLTGFTLGNYNEAKLLEKIGWLMSDHDFLFVDARLHDLNDWDGRSPVSKQKISHLINSYVQESTNRFAFGPVEAATTATITDVIFDYRINREMTTVPRALNITVCCSNLKTKMRLSGKVVDKEHLDLASTTFYSFDDLRRWFPKAGFNCVWNKQEDRVALFLLARSRP